MEAEFERILEGMRQKVAGLPPKQQEALEPLFRETVERHRQIMQSVEAGRMAAEQYEKMLEQLCTTLNRLAEVTQDTVIVLKYARFDAEAKKREAGEGDG